MNPHSSTSIARQVLKFAVAGVLFTPITSAFAQPVSPERDADGPKRVVTPNRVTIQPEQNQATDQPASEQDNPVDKGDTVSFAAFSEPVELATLVDYVGSTLGINIIVKGSLNGTVTFNAPIDVPKTDLMDLLDAILEQYDFSITQDASGIYTVQASSETPVTFGGQRATSKIIDTRGLRPSGLQDAIGAILQKGAGAPNAAQTQGNIAYLDELGVLIMTGTPRDIARVEQVIDDLHERYAQSTFSRIELDHIAAPVARQRVIQLVGGGTSNSPTTNRNQQVPNRNQPNIQNQTAGSGSGLDNIADRLTVDAQSNALIFRGNDSELVQVLDVIKVIDVPNEMERKQYFAGSAVLQIADLAKQRGLGEVITLEDTSQNQFNNVFRGQPQQQNSNLNQSQQITGGPIMVVDERRQSIIYYGTAAQQEELADWIKLLDVSEDIITLEYYKLSNAQAADVAEIIQGLISGRTQTGDSALLPNNQGFNQFGQFQNQVQTNSGEEAGFAPDPNRVFVIADEANNQVIVKAPKKQQDEFAKLVGRLDLRRPQVYLEATIVAVTDSRDFRLAVESQLSAGQFQAQDNFGISTAGTTFQDPRAVATGLSGFTSALIRSDMVPFIITAVQTDTDSRILSSPQLLVNDNEEATIASIEQQPTTTTTQGNATTDTSFAGFEDAGTTLTVTPTISEAGYIRLEYDVELSNFVGTGSNGIPAPRQQRNVNGIATIPSDATIVVGGIEVQDINHTVVKVPLLGDIPIVGNLFRDNNKTNSKTLLYIFITPRIMTDPTFQDLRLLTRGPQGQSELESRIPKLEPVQIKMVAPRKFAPAKQEEDQAQSGQE